MRLFTWVPPLLSLSLSFLPGVGPVLLVRAILSMCGRFLGRGNARCWGTPVSHPSRELLPSEGGEDFCMRARVTLSDASCIRPVSMPAMCQCRGPSGSARASHAGVFASPSRGVCRLSPPRARACVSSSSSPQEGGIPRPGFLRGEGAPEGQEKREREREGPRSKGAP